ncbi:MAG: hypothetical protein KGH57_03875 [Candidatus Micrarchaeota archaeon]|nr:hypothetical protein [Candidatus Micrarchaeota archaeon]
MAASENTTRFRSRAHEPAFAKLIGYHEWASDTFRMEPIRVDYFDLQFIGVANLSRVQAGISSGIARRIGREAADMYPVSLQRNSVIVYSSKSRKRPLSEISVNLGENKDIPYENAKVVSIKVKNKGTEQTDDSIRSIVLETLTSLRKLTNSELENFLDTGEMVFLVR